MRTIIVLTALTVAAAAAAPIAGARQAAASGAAVAALGPGTAGPHAAGPYLTEHAAIRASLDRIAAGSPLWREARDRVRETGRLALILTPDDVVVGDAPGRPAVDAFDASTLAEVSPVPHGDSVVDVVLVVINLELLERVHARLGSSRDAFEADLDRILIHEVYGHAVPYLLAGSLAGRCPDPQPGQRTADACSIRRENAVRAELRLGRRSDYGVSGLALGRRPGRL